MILKRIVLSLVIIAAILFGLFKTYTHFYRPSTHKLNADLQWLGVIQESPQDVTLNSLMNGEDSLLVIDHANLLYHSLIQKIPKAKLLRPDEVLNLNNLYLFADSPNNLITHKHEIFKHLFVIRFYDNGNRNEIKSLPQAGIKGIYLNNTTLTGEYLILMEDGSERILISPEKIEKK